MKLKEFTYELRKFVKTSNKEITSLQTMLAESEKQFFDAYDAIDVTEFTQVKGGMGGPAKRKSKMRAQLKELIEKANAIIPRTVQNDYEQIQRFYELFFDETGTPREEANVKELQRSGLFHIACTDKYETKKRGELFVMPNKLLNKTPKYRFNPDGAPCIYMASTLYNAWEETRRPDFEKANFVLFRPQKKLRVMSLYLEPRMLRYGEFAMAYFTLISSRKTDDGDRHHYQYVVPNLFMAILTHHIAVNKKSPIDGIRYLSSRGFDGEEYQFQSKDIDEAFVFPQRLNDKGELDAGYLRKMFTMTDPRNYFYYKVHRYDFGTGAARVSDYRDSLYFAIEEQLRAEKATKIEE